MPANPKTLYVVATPIGNLQDISQRALDVLASVDIIAAEDTRHSQKLLEHFSIKTPMMPCHQHNENKVFEKIIKELQLGRSVALISDAGTPLISDPGYPLVQAARDAGLVVVAIPGPSSVIAALSVSGLPSDKFTFVGFLPAKSTQRLAVLKEYLHHQETQIYFEAPHRVVDTLQDMREVFGVDRKVCLARELTKIYESVAVHCIEDMLAAFASEQIPKQGEMVLVVAGKKQEKQDITPDAEKLLALLINEVSVSTAAKIVAQYTGIAKRTLYEHALLLQDQVTKD